MNNLTTIKENIINKLNNNISFYDRNLMNGTQTAQIFMSLYIRMGLQSTLNIVKQEFVDIKNAKNTVIERISEFQNKLNPSYFRYTNFSDYDKNMIAYQQLGMIYGLNTIDQVISENKEPLQETVS